MKSSWNTRLLFDDNNVFYGINLGHGHCSEQEHGIQKIQKDCGIYNLYDTCLNAYTTMYEVTRHDDSVYFYSDKELLSRYKVICGIENKKIRKIPPVTIYDFEAYSYYKHSRSKEKVPMCALILGEYYCHDNYYVGMADNVVLADFFVSKEYNAVWGDSGFGVCCETHNKKYLYKLLFALYNLDAMIFVFDGDLYITITSLTPQSLIDKITEDDENTHKLYMDGVDTNIYEDVQKYGDIKVCCIYPVGYKDNEVVFHFYTPYSLGNNVQYLYNRTKDEIIKYIKYKITEKKK